MSRAAIWLAAVGTMLGVLVVPAADAPRSAHAQGSCADPGARLPVVAVHGFAGTPSDVEALRGLEGLDYFVDVFDFAAHAQGWVSAPAIGPALAERIQCLAERSAAAGGAGQVVVVGHSTGGLVARFAVAQVPGRVAMVVTIGTPFHGSPLAGGAANDASGVAARNGAEWLLALGCSDAADPFGPSVTCRAWEHLASPAGRALGVGSPELASLPMFPPELPVLTIAGQLQLMQTVGSWSGGTDYPNGDLIVPVTSALAGAQREDLGGGAFVRPCGLSITVVPATELTIADRGCLHAALPADPLVLERVASALAQVVEATRPREVLDESSVVTFDGVGPVKIGMTPDQASAVAGLPFQISAGDFSGCSYLDFVGGPPGLSFILLDGRIARVGVYPPSSIATRSGVRIGVGEADVQRTYPGRIALEPHPYTDGRYLVLAEEGGGGAMIFETDELGMVRSYRAGEASAVIELIEGCS